MTKESQILQMSKIQITLSSPQCPMQGRKNMAYNSRGQPALLDSIRVSASAIFIVLNIKQ